MASAASVDHKVAMFQLATDRKKARKPVWEETIDLTDVFYDQARSFRERRDVIVERLRKSRWYQNADPDECDGIRELVDDHLAHADDAGDFDSWWGEVYDHADWARVWIAVR